MKRYISMIVLAVLALLPVGKAAAATNVRLTAEDVVLESNTAQQAYSMYIGYNKVGEDITSVQFDVVLPAGVQYVTQKKNTTAAFTEHAINAAKQADGSYRIILSSQSLATISPVERLIGITFNVNPSILPNGAAIDFKNIVMVTTSGTILKQDAFKVHIIKESDNRVWTYIMRNASISPSTSEKGGFILEYDDDASNLCGMQFDFYLDDALQIDMNGDLPEFEINENVVNGHQVNCSKLSDGGYRVIISSQSLTPFHGRGAPILTHFGLKYVPTDGRDVTVTTKNVRFVTNTGAVVYVAPNTSVIKCGYRVAFFDEDDDAYDVQYVRPGQSYTTPVNVPPLFSTPSDYSFHSWMPALEEVTDHDLEFRPMFKTTFENLYSLGAYYLQNEETGKFLQAGNNWGTQASLGSGIEFILEGSDGDYTLDSRVMNTTLKHYLGVEGFLDQNAINLSFVDKGLGKRFKIAKEDGTVLTANDTDTRVTFQPNEDNPYNRWKLVTKEQRLNQLRIDAINGETNLDATFMIQDPDFAPMNTERRTAWNEATAPVIGGPGSSSAGCNLVAEKWGGNSQTFTVQQTLRGLPSGTYRLECQGFYRYNNTEDNTNVVAVETHADGTEHINSYLMGNNVRQPLMSIVDEEAAAALEDDIIFSDNNQGLPFSLTQASKAFDKGLYENSLEFQVTDGTAVIGIVKDVHEGCDWTVFDNFRLTYLAPAAVEEEYDNEPLYLQNVETGEFLEGGNSWGTQASLGSGIEFLVSGSNGEYIFDSGIKLEGEKHYMDNSSYLDGDATVMHLYNNADGTFTIMNDEGNVLTAYSGSTAVDFNSPSASNYNLWRFVTKQERLMDMRRRAMNGETEIDATFLIQDPNFGRNDQRISAWQTESTVSPVLGGLANVTTSNYVAERWGGDTQTFTIQQTVKGLPNGRYRLECQGFYRYNNTTGNNNAAAVEAHANGTEEIYSFLMGNDVRQPLCSIVNDEAADFLSDVITFNYNNQGLPFGMSDASRVFDEGLYENSLEFQVVNGTAVIGITKTNHTGTDWTIFDNFRLTLLTPVANISTVTFEIHEALRNGSYDMEDINNMVDTILER